MSIRVTAHETAAETGEHVADLLIGAVRAKPHLVLGLPTGSTMVPVYRKLVEAYRQGRVSFRQVKTVNVDEYIGIPATHPGAFAFYMQEHFFRHIDLDRRHGHLPDGCAPDLEAEVEAYERLIAKLGGLDLLLLGLGRNGHIAFNEPGSAPDSGTRVVCLAPSTLLANRSSFATAAEQPTRAVTIGLGTIRRARKVVLVATGALKSAAVRALLTGEAVGRCPAAALRDHPSVELVTDRAALDMHL